MLCNAELMTQNSLGCRSAQQHQDLRLNYIDLCLKPQPACADLNRVGLLVQASFATRLPLEVFHDVGYIHIAALNAGRCQRFVQYSPCWTNKGASLNIFFIPGLLAHHHHSCCWPALSKNSLRAQLPQTASFTASSSSAQL